MSDAVNHRRFAVHAQGEDRHHAKVVEETSFEAAAVAFAEDAHFSAEPEIRLVVRDLESGREHCFLVDVDSGQTEACS